MANKGNLYQQQATQGKQTTAGAITTDSFGNPVSMIGGGKNPAIDNNFVLGEGIQLDQGYYYIDQYDENIIEHRIQNKIYDLEDIHELQDTTIFELLPKPVELPASF